MRSQYLVTLAILVLGIQRSAIGGCAKVVVTGDTCNTLQVNFDLSKCTGEKGNRKTQPTCKGAKAMASVGGRNGTYSVELNKKEGWGESTWSVGSVTYKTTPSRRVANENSRSKATSRNPSAVAIVPAAPVAPAAPTVPVTPAAPTAPASPVTDFWTDAGIQFGANFDAYYSYNFNQPAIPTVPIVTGSATNFAPVTTIPAPSTQIRYYDSYANQFTLNLAEFSVRKKKGEVGFTLDLDFGTMADLNSTDEVGKHVGQAFVSYSPTGIPGLTIEFGKMPTHLGYELIKSKDNWQYSRSTTFGFGSPFWNTGLHIGYELMPELTVSGYVNNTSVNNGFYALGPNKSLGLQVKIVPSTKTTVIYNLVSGGRDSLTANNDITIHEANLVYNHSDDLAFALETLAGHDTNGPGYGDSTWYGVTAHTKYKFNSRYSISPRLEWFYDSTGYRTATTSEHTLWGVTLTNSFALTPELETRLEFRYDTSSKSVFSRGDGTTTPNQGTVTMGILYSFGK